MVTIQLLAIASYVPTRLLFGPTRAVVNPASIYILWTLTMFLGALLYLTLRLVIRSDWSVLALCSVFLVFFWNWNNDSTFASVLSALLLFIAMLGVRLIAHKRWFVAAAASLSVTLTLTTFASLGVSQRPPPVMGSQASLKLGALHKTPNIILLVLDGYGRADVLEEVFGYDNQMFLGSLREKGFDVASNSTTSYSITHLALPALLEMSHIHEPGARLSVSDQEVSKQTISGTNRLVAILKSAGYEYSHFGADRRLHTCLDVADRCALGPIADVTMFEALKRTPIGRLLYPNTGDPNVPLTLYQLHAMSALPAQLDRAEKPTFAFFHVPLPHPPMFLDAACQVRLSPDLAGHTLSTATATQPELDLRRSAWIEQVKCANTAVLDLIAKVDPSDVIVVLSDHGPDSVFDVSNVTESGLHERIPNLTAVRMADECRGTLPNNIQIQNVFRVVLSCLSGERIALEPNQSYIAGFTGPIVAVPQAH